MDSEELAIKPHPYIHPTAEAQSYPGSGTKVWRNAHIRETATVGEDCVIGMGAYIDKGVAIGDKCKVGNYACIFGPSIIGEGVFIGPGVMLTNDRHPQATDTEGNLAVEGKAWNPAGVMVEDGASIGAGTIVLSGVRIGRKARIGAGAVVTRDVPDNETWMGVPAK